MEKKEYAEMKKSLVMAIKSRNSLTTGECIKLLQKLNKYSQERDMWIYCLANFDVSIEDMPDDLKYDPDFMIRCSVVKPTILKEIQSTNKALYRIIFKRLGPKAVKQIKDRIKGEEISDQAVSK